MKQDRYFKFIAAIVVLGLFTAFSQASAGAPAGRPVSTVAFRTAP